MRPAHWHTDTSAKLLAEELIFLRRVREAKDPKTVSAQQQNVSDELLDNLTEAVIRLLVRAHKQDTGKELEIELPD